MESFDILVFVLKCGVNFLSLVVLFLGGLLRLKDDVLIFGIKNSMLQDFYDSNYMFFLVVRLCVVRSAIVVFLC